MIKRNFPIPFPTLFELTKVRISLAVSLTALTGFIIYSQSFIPDLIFPVAGVFLLASGASALNHIQEKNVDSRMDRTSGRPLPVGAIQSKHALIIAILFIMPGSIVLLLSSLSALILGLIALLWYNGIYTYLKRVTAFAVVPGS
ncbi:MAG: UbiA family prenyltransferase, partial [Bacteroidales bacterium]